MYDSFSLCVNLGLAFTLQLSNELWERDSVCSGFTDYDFMRVLIVSTDAIGFDVRYCVSVLDCFHDRFDGLFWLCISKR